MVTILVVDVDDHRCGLLADAVVEVLRAVAVLPLPGVPVGVDGVIDVRGEIVAVIELRARLGGRSRPPALRDHIVLARSREGKIGLRVDRALDLADLADGEILAAVDVSSSPRVQGVMRLEDGLLLVHDVDTFLSESDAIELGAALARFDVAGARP